MTLLSVNNAQIYVEDTGAPVDRPNAPVVVFGHGLLFSGRMFAAQVGRLRADYRCVTIDWRGQGKTPAADEGYDMETLYDDAAALIVGLDVGPVHYVGLSMGGFVGLRLAARRPELIRSLSLLDTSGGPEDLDKAAKYRQLARIYRWVGIGPLKGKVKPLMFGPTFLADPASKAATDRWEAELRSADRLGMKKAIKGVTDRLAITQELVNITCPTQVVVGEDDVATPLAKAQTLVAGIAGAELHTVPQSGHSSTIEQPEALADLLEAFLQSQTGLR